MKQALIPIIGVIALILKLVFDVEIDEVVQAELADLLVNITLIGAPVIYAIRKKLKLDKNKDDTQ